MRLAAIAALTLLVGCTDDKPRPSAEPGQECRSDFNCAGPGNLCACKPNPGAFACEIGKDPSFCAPICKTDFEPELDPATDPEGAAVEQEILERKLDESCPEGWSCAGKLFGFRAPNVRHCLPD